MSTTPPSPSWLWSCPENDPALASLLDVLVEGGHLRRGGKSDPEICFESSAVAGELRVSAQNGGWTIVYGGLPAAARGLSLVLAGVEGGGHCSFKNTGIMLDASRNAVMRVETVKLWMRQLALLGFNCFYLYLEDTYELPGEPFFGYKRGGYSAEEIRELDAYAERLGIELVGCIQTLGHMHQILKWEAYAGVRDTDGILLAESDATYTLIDKMFAFWSSNTRSRRIHIGMDEATELGRGQYADLNGPVPKFEIFSRHLQRVTALAEGHGLQPAIWSDMFFRLGNSAHDYYSRNTVIPENVRKQIPEAVELVYWDYCTKDEDFYREWISKHRELGKEPVMASGVWTWARFWYDHKTTEDTVRPCLAACRNENVREVFFTMWGDGGSYCEFDSAWAGLAFAADLCWGGAGQPSTIAPLLSAVTGIDYEAVVELSREAMSDPTGGTELRPATVLWDDLLLGIGWQGVAARNPLLWEEGAAHWKALAADCRSKAETQTLPDFSYFAAVLELASTKAFFRSELVRAYADRDHEALKKLYKVEIPLLRQGLDELGKTFRKQWLRRNKPFGMETFQMRLGGMRARLDEVAIRLEEFLAGTNESIPELETREKLAGGHSVAYYYWLATGSSVI